MRIVVAAAITLLGTTWVAWAQGAWVALPLTLGIGLGATLWQSAFSFAGAWRRAITERRTEGVRAQCLLVALTAALFLPALAMEEVFGRPLRGFVFPTGLALAVGAFLFGVGMQWGGGCGSGTLYGAGAGGTRAWLTLAGFVAGATLAAGAADLWMPWPALPALSLPDHLGTPATLLGTMALLAAASLAARRWDRTPAPTPRSIFAITDPSRWSLGTGALLLAALGFLTLLALGRPWAITAALPLWGSKLVDSLGLHDPAFWTFWDDPTRSEALLRPVLSDRTTLMNLGVIAGASLAAAIAGRPGGPWRAPPGPVLAALLGGCLMGVGAVLASGCNVSAFLGGVASGSLHGWAWIPCALAGSALGIRTRPWFGLTRR